MLLYNCKGGKNKMKLRNIVIFTLILIVFTLITTSFSNYTSNSINKCVEAGHSEHFCVMSLKQEEIKMQNEIWKDIPGYEGLYQMSNLKNIKSLERYDKRGRLLKEKIMKPSYVANTLRIGLVKDGKQKVIFIDRLYKEMFEK